MRNDASLLLRLPDWMKTELLRQGARNGRRITAEINLRLQASLEEQAVAVTEHARCLLDLVRALPPEKQAALLALLHEADADGGGARGDG